MSFRGRFSRNRQGDSYIVERSISNANAFVAVANTPASATAGYRKYTVSVDAVQQPVYYRLKMMSVNGSVSYSPTVYMNTAAGADIRVVRNTNGIIVESSHWIKEVVISDITGRIVTEKL